jgi:rare lipoprotein A (peptidoglycan hydrolase)
MMTLMAVGQILLLALLGAPRPVTETGQAGVFGTAGDRLAGGPLACSGRWLGSRDLVCAHRTLPCGTALLVQNLRTRRIVPCLVLDRGPYGALLPDGQFVIKRSRREAGRWRSIVDLSPQVATLLGISGVVPVQIYYLPHLRGIPQKGHGRRSRAESARRPPQLRLASL